MNIDTIKGHIPEYAKDIRLNLSKVLSQDGSSNLSDTQIAGTFLASVYATQNDALIKQVEDAVAGNLSDNHRQGAKTAAALMAMNNIYYRFSHSVKDDAFKQLPAGLRMQAIANPGVEKLDFEIYSLAVSAINGCSMCMDAHTSAIMKHGINHEGIQDIIRIASVAHATAQVFITEDIHS